jgi:hypothetical protein
VDHPEKWEGVNLGEYDAFHWWKNLDVGHGMAMFAAIVKQWLLFGMVMHLAITLLVVTRIARRSHDNNHLDVSG